MLTWPQRRCSCAFLSSQWLRHPRTFLPDLPPRRHRQGAQEELWVRAQQWHLLVLPAQTCRLAVRVQYLRRNSRDDSKNKSSRTRMISSLALLRTCFRRNVKVDVHFLYDRHHFATLCKQQSLVITYIATMNPTFWCFLQQ